ncbi:hypothetical protein [Proteus terrae]|uniref:hypothetical protein n=1 Tax=Proteus terrae TaxID=1574161 RepID=UPI001CBDABEB|nr:hypothetical protein [Proteus terrae]UAX00664.1 hypothetical protein KDN45_11515 [Proteus terrae subsp. cibarius]
MMKTAISKVDELLLRAEKIVWMKINAEVTSILKSNDNPAKAFVCAMGGWSFYDSEGVSLAPNENYAEKLASLIDKYEEAFKLTGAGFHWKLVDGKVTHDGDW